MQEVGVPWQTLITTLNNAVLMVQLVTQYIATRAINIVMPQPTHNT